MSSLKLALRTLRQSPGFTLIAVVTLALGIGLNTAMFSVINALILRPIALPDADRLFLLNRTTSHDQHGGNSPGNVRDLQRDSADFAQLAPFRDWGYTLALPGRPPEMLNSFRVSPDFFPTLGVQPLLGRGFRPDEDQPGKNAVIVLSHRLWQSTFGGDPAVIGRVVRLDGESAEVVGVMPPSIEASGVFGYIQMYRPAGLKEDERASRTDTSFGVLVRLHPGVTLAQAETRFAALASRLVVDFPKENADSGLRVVPLQATRIGDTGRQITFMLLSLSGFVLLIACANLANLLLARAIARAREFAIRAALGASRLQLIRPLAAECVVLALAGGAFGLLVNYWTTAWMERQFGGEEQLLRFPFDSRVLVFAVLASLVTALFFGVVPAWIVSRVRINETLKSGTRGSTGDRSHHRFRQVLIVGQFALALVLLTGAAFFVRGLDRLLHRQAGWNPLPLVSAMVSLPTAKTTDPDKMLLFYQDVQARLGALPGVKGTTVSLDLPTWGFKGPRGYLIEGQEAPAVGREPVAFTNAVSPEYFDVVGTHLLRGRGIAATDTRTSPPVVVINESMALSLFPGGDAIGHRLARSDQPQAEWAEIVGVVEDVHFLNISPAPTAFQLYIPLAKETWGYVAITVQAAEPTAVATLVDPMRRAVAEIDPDLPLLGLAPMSTTIERNLSEFRVINRLLVSFAILGLFLAALGIYGVIARLVAQRTGEIGIRMALGAQMKDVVRLILAAGLRMVLVGTVLGLLGSAGLGMFLFKVMPGMATSGTTAIGIATILLSVIALLACWLPARKAAQVNPLIALRAE